MKSVIENLRVGRHGLTYGENKALEKIVGEYPDGKLADLVHQLKISGERQKYGELNYDGHDIRALVSIDGRRINFHVFGSKAFYME